ncbi:hypothetical protein [Caldisalinibacter kiritimatiensis]|uniref:Uncharacterized protein n=1 Tax=Caldisalinibacter kiritimatiensis TaxID=1304284 RepID=R1AY89_9FIRM|nr:hypothetical protein [Caldisalinibacter kiritimatiensis]EOD01647.1 hypothetical protein L21TH_0253 [Caldisalinibacter kiritimatiensis]
MNELTVSTSNTTAPAMNLKPLNNILPFFAMFIVIKNMPNINTFVADISSNIKLNNFKLDNISPEKVEKSLTVVKKIGPYLPEPTINVLNNVIPTLEKVSKIITLVNLVSTNKTFTPIKPVNKSDSNIPVNEIVDILKDEMPKDTMNKIGPFIDIAVNFDKYKPILQVLSNLNSADGDTNKNQIDTLIDAVIPILSDKNNKNNEKMKDMVQMVEMLKLISNDEGKENPSNKNK